MSLTVVPAGYTFTKFSRRVRLPYIEDVKAYHLYGTDFATSSKNKALNPLGAMVAVGSPTYGAGYATISNANGFNLGYINGRPYTQIIVSTYAGAGGAGLMGHWPTTTAGKSDLLLFSSGALQPSVDGSGHGSIAAGTVPITGFSLYAVTYDQANAILYAGNGATMLSNSAAYASANQPDGNIFVGATGFGSGSFNVAASAVYQRALSASEIADVYAYLKPFLATRGITVT